uniref:NADH-ubiquinone oxidoreductase chain 2 n=1 Tax=Colasposoma sp. EMHAU-15070314 TaxID=2480060 RepID=A0A3G3C747_9CUCU|nr:NADH dehydrogenase subunit 2 [Colasposoma sp. EMHAU-15070314]
MFKFYKLIFFMTMIIGSLITISSYSWMSMWMGLEVNLLSIIPLLKKSNNKFPAESAFKYFVVQSIASTLFLFSMILNCNLIDQINDFSSKIINTIFFISILMKIGSAPFHAWFPEVLEGLSWGNCFLMMTWQKIAPMIILLQNFKMTNLIIMVIIFSSFLSSILGLNQISLRKIMAYSSINHISWMLSSISSTKIIWLIYFLIYSLISLVIIFSLNYSNTYFLHQMKIFSSNKPLNLMINLNFLSLGGLPPFLGFYPKWLTINYLNFINHYILTLILILFTLIFLFIYTRIMFSSMTLLMVENKNIDFINKTPTLMFLNMGILMMILFSPVMFNYL